jgi:hypothetical protein
VTIGHNLTQDMSEIISSSFYVYLSISCLAVLDIMLFATVLNLAWTMAVIHPDKWTDGPD